MGEPKSQYNRGWFTVGPFGRAKLGQTRAKKHVKQLTKDDRYEAKTVFSPEEGWLVYYRGNE